LSNSARLRRVCETQFTTWLLGARFECELFQGEKDSTPAQHRHFQRESEQIPRGNKRVYKQMGGQVERVHSQLLGDIREFDPCAQSQSATSHFAQTKSQTAQQQFVCGKHVTIDLVQVLASQTIGRLQRAMSKLVFVQIVIVIVIVVVECKR